MYKFLSKNGQMMAFILAAAIIGISLIVIFSGLDDFNALPSEKPDDQRGTTSIFNIGLGATVFMTILCVIAMFAFGIFHILTDLKGSTKGLMGFGVLAIIAVIAYATASSAPETDLLATLFEKNAITDGSSKFISSSIWTLVALLGIATIGLILSELRNFFK